MKQRNEAFWRLVNAYVRQKNCSHSTAAKELKKYFPDLENVTQTQVDDFRTSEITETPLFENKPGEFKDYIALCRDHQADHGGSLIDAMRAIDKLWPESREQYIEKVNREREVKNTPPSKASVDGKNFLEMARYLKLEHKMTTLQAHKYIDRQWPGLRQAYINSVNE